MSTEKLKKFIENCFKERDELRVLEIAIVLEDDVISCVPTIQTSSLELKKDFEDKLKSIDGQNSGRSQLHKIRKYFYNNGFKTSFKNDILIIRKYY